MPRRTRSLLSPPAGQALAVRKLSPAAEAWVRNALRRMTLEEKLGQMLMIACYGQFLPVDSPELRELERQVEENRVGGLMIATHAGALGIERSQAYATAALVNRLQTRAKLPLLVAGDFERGTAMRIEEGTSFPHAMAIAATGRTEDAYTVGRITAVEARAIGVPWVFAPAADVNSDPNNPIINVRSFGEDPRRVAEFVAAYVRGAQNNGVLATAKHFPGHGDTDTDSHLDLSTVKSDLAHLKSVELLPFRAAISAGVHTIMTGHLAVPAIEPDRDLPATLSEKITTDLLRRKMRFEGLVVTDALNMGGVTVRYAPAEAAVRSALAGSDVLLLPPSSDAALAGLREAAASGRLPLSRIDDAVTQILRAKVRLGLHKERSVKLEGLAKTVARPDFERAALDVADRGVTLLRDTAHLLPLDATRPARGLLIAIAGDPDRAPAQAFERELRWRVDSLETLRFDTRFATIDALNLPRANTYDVMIVAILIRFADRKGTVALPEDQATAMRRLLTSDKPTIVVCFGSPYVIARFPEAKTWLAAFSTADVAQHATARAMFGQVPIGGHIPVSVRGAVSLGTGLDLPANPMKLAAGGRAMAAKLAPACVLLDRAVSERAFPGGVLAAGYRGQLTIHAFGKLSYDANATAVRPDTIYDAASLTKPVVTATLAAMLQESGDVDIDAPVTRYLPEWAAGPNPVWRARVTVRHLLTHSSGLPAHEDYFKTLKSRRAIVARVLGEELAYEPGTRAVYSDLGFIALGEIVELLTGRALGWLAHQRIFEPLGMADSLFNPPKALRARIAPTENDAAYRKRVVRGEVHDENACAMSGVAGHAGMFTTAADLSAFCQMLLNGGLYAHQRLLRRQTITQFTTPSPLAAHTQAIGWTVPTPNSSSGRYFSARGFGHLGFTGTSMWIDPDKQLFVVLLTNRVHPTRSNDKIREVRPALHDAIVEALGLAKQ